MNGLQPWLSPYADYLVGIGARYGVKVSSVRRTYAQQSRLYWRYITGQSQFPAAPPGQSLHEAGRAFDLVADPRVLAYLGAIWEAWGGRWGGRGRDPIHFEY